MGSKPQYRKLVSAAELAEFLGVSKRTVQRLKDADLIRPYRVTPTCPRYDLDEILEQLQSAREERHER